MKYPSYIAQTLVCASRICKMPDIREFFGVPLEVRRKMQSDRAKARGDIRGFFPVTPGARRGRQVDRTPWQASDTARLVQSTLSGEHIPTDSIFGFGKFKGARVSDVITCPNGRQYLEWCERNLDSANNHTLLAAITSQLDRGRSPN
jgi:hypothetical protein